MPANSPAPSGDWRDLRQSALHAYSAGTVVPGLSRLPNLSCRSVAPVTCRLGSPGELRADIGSDLLRWLVLADTPYWMPLHISQAAVIAAWRAKKRLVRRLAHHPLLLCPTVPAGELPLPHLAIARVRCKKHPPRRDWLPLLDRLLPDTMTGLGRPPLLSTGNDR